MGMTSATQICNLALSWVAGNGLTSLADDQSPEGILCRANYDSSRRAVLEEREWTFAIKRVILNPLAESPEFGYQYQFQIPADSVRILTVRIPAGNLLTDVLHLVEDDKILCDEQAVYIRYLRNLDNTNKFSNLFTEALAAHIAQKIALPLTNNRTLMVDMITLYDDKLQRAQSTDALQGSRERLDRSRMERSRRHYVPFD